MTSRQKYEGRRLPVAAVLVVAALALAGCGGTDDTTSEEPQDDVTEEDAETSADDVSEDDAQTTGESQELILATGAPSAMAIGEGQQFFAERVEELTDGELTFQVHLDGALYNERTSLEALQSGEIHVGGASNANFGAFSDALFWMDLPFLIDSADSLSDIMKSEFGQEVLGQVEEDGFKVLASLPNGGFRSVVNNANEVVGPDDLNGLLMRTTASPVEIAMFEAWGASPTAVDWGETYDALSQGVVDGEFVMWTWLDAASHCEVLEHGTEGPFAIGLQFIAMETSRFYDLPAHLQDALVEAGSETEALVADLDAEANAEARASCIEQGVTIRTLTDAEIEPWRESSQEVWDRFSGEVPAETIERIREIQG